MGDWPATIFSKLPYLEHEGKEYLGEDFEICFMAIGDAYCAERYPLQVRPFAKGLELKDRLKELVIEGGGGGQTTESYDLAGYYALEKVKIPNAIKPILIFIGDEQCYDMVDRGQVENLLGTKMEKALPIDVLFKKLREKFSVYIIRKPYGSSSGNSLSEEDRRITKHWANLVGDDHIANLPAADRVVDVIFGIFAKETSRVAYFEQELEDRQLKDKDGDKKVELVYKSLRTIHGDGVDKGRKLLGTGKSVTRRATGGKSVKPLV
jgi:hypothetical protein